MGLAHPHRATKELRCPQFFAQDGAARIHYAATHTHSDVPSYMVGGLRIMVGDADFNTH
jgi:hypothetical protein